MSKKIIYNVFKEYERNKNYSSIHALGRTILERLYEYATWASPEELTAEINFLKEMLSSFEEDIVNTAKQVEICEHTWGTPTYTVERRVLGNFVYVYRVECTSCGFSKSKQVDEEKDKPEWAEGAKQQYYNNFI